MATLQASRSKRACLKPLAGRKVVLLKIIIVLATAVINCTWSVYSCAMRGNSNTVVPAALPLFTVLSLGSVGDGQVTKRVLKKKDSSPISSLNLKDIRKRYVNSQTQSSADRSNRYSGGYGSRAGSRTARSPRGKRGTDSDAAPSWVGGVGGSVGGVQELLAVATRALGQDAGEAALLELVLLQLLRAVRLSVRLLSSVIRVGGDTVASVLSGLVKGAGGLLQLCSRSMLMLADYLEQQHQQHQRLTKEVPAGSAVGGWLQVAYPVHKVEQQDHAVEVGEDGGQEHLQEQSIANPRRPQQRAQKWPHKKSKSNTNGLRRAAGVLHVSGETCVWAGEVVESVTAGLGEAMQDSFRSLEMVPGAAHSAVQFLFRHKLSGSHSTGWVASASQAAGINALEELYDNVTVAPAAAAAAAEVWVDGTRTNTSGCYCYPTVAELRISKDDASDVSSSNHNQLCPNRGDDWSGNYVEADEDEYEGGEEGNDGCGEGEDDVCYSTVEEVCACPRDQGNSVQQEELGLGAHFSFSEALHQQLSPRGFSSKMPAPDARSPQQPSRRERKSTGGPGEIRGRVNTDSTNTRGSSKGEYGHSSGGGSDDNCSRGDRRSGSGSEGDGSSGDYGHSSSSGSGDYGENQSKASARGSSVSAAFEEIRAFLASYVYRDWLLTLRMTKQGVAASAQTLGRFVAPLQDAVARQHGLGPYSRSRSAPPTSAWALLWGQEAELSGDGSEAVGSVSSRLVEADVPSQAPFFCLALVVSAVVALLHRPCGGGPGCVGALRKAAALLVLWLLLWGLFLVDEALQREQLALRARTQAVDQLLREQAQRSHHRSPADRPHHSGVSGEGASVGSGAAAASYSSVASDAAALLYGGKEDDSDIDRDSDSTGLGRKVGSGAEFTLNYQDVTWLNSAVLAMWEMRELDLPGRTEGGGPGAEGGWALGGLGPYISDMYADMVNTEVSSDSAV